MVSKPDWEEGVNSLGLAQSIVVVTGAGGHLGQAIVRGLARDGAIPVLLGRRVEPLNALFETLRSDGFESIVVSGDVTDAPFIESEFKRLNAAATKRGLLFDGLVNNAFAGRNVDAAADEASLFAEASRTNIGATAHLTRTFAKLEGNHPRSAVNIASMYALVSPDPALYPKDVPVNPAYYGATKAGLVQLGRYLAIELAGQNCRVNTVAPGAFPTAEVQSAHPDFVARLAERTPLKRLGQADEVYPPIRFLLGKDASFVTGSLVAVDGGWTAI